MKQQVMPDGYNVRLPRETMAQLAAPTADRRPLPEEMVATVAVTDIIAALELHPTDAFIREILCGILLKKHDKQSIPVLITSLHDENRIVRAVAADALAHSGDASTGPALLAQYALEPTGTQGVQADIAAALGALHYTPAIPTLVNALNSTEQMARQCAAWSLGKLHAHSARGDLEATLAKEDRRQSDA